MPFDSNGVATVTRQLAVTGQTIEAVQVNVPFADIQSMLSQALLRSGVAPMTGNLNMNSFKITGLAAGTVSGNAVEFSQLDEKSDSLQPYIGVGSASTTNIGAAASENVTITGTTTINSFGSAPAGTVRNLLFLNALTIVYNPGSIIIPGATNLVTKSNQSLRAVSFGPGLWRITDTSFGEGPSLTAGQGLTSVGSLSTGMTLTVDLSQFGSVTALSSPRVVVTDGVVAGSTARMTPDDFKKVFTVPGFYTGSDANLTNYPIGTTIFAKRGGAAAIARNQTGNIYYDNSSSDAFTRVATGNTLLSGTWVSRGGSADFVFMQKIAN